MGLLADVGGISGVIGTLSDIKVPAGAIADIVAIIDSTQEAIDRPDLLPEVNPSWFGGSASASVLALHTGKAHLTLSNAILEAVASVQATTAAMTDFDHVLTQKDEDRSVAAHTLVVQTEQAVNQMDGDRNTAPSLPPTTDAEGGN